MTKRHWTVVGIGLVIAVIGVGFGFSPIGLPNGVSCGSAWSTTYVPYFSEQCSDARSGKSTLAIVVLIAGLAVAAAGVLAAYLSKPPVSSSAE